MASDHGNDDAYARARRDPDFLAAVRLAYSGSRDLLNALWWMSRPADAAPDGAPSPLDELRDLQRRVFSADGGSLGDPEATRAIRELEAELSAERQAITDAVNAADLGHGPGLESLFPEDQGTSAGRGRLVVGIGLVAALVCGILIGAEWSGGRVDASPAVTPSVGPTASPAPFARVEAACAQMSDVTTIVLNAGSAFAEKRWTEQEWQGALAVAARVLERVDTDDGTALSSRIDQLKILFPADRSTPRQTLEMTPETNAAYQNVSDACRAAGSPIAVSGWTGG